LLSDRVSRKGGHAARKISSTQYVTIALLRVGIGQTPKHAAASGLIRSRH
jgi:hypothetical protein